MFTGELFIIQKSEYIYMFTTYELWLKDRNKKEVN